MQTILKWSWTAWGKIRLIELTDSFYGPVMYGLKQSQTVLTLLTTGDSLYINWPHTLRNGCHAIMRGRGEECTRVWMRLTMRGQTRDCQDPGTARILLRYWSRTLLTSLLGISMDILNVTLCHNGEIWDDPPSLPNSVLDVTKTWLLDNLNLFLVCTLMNALRTEFYYKAQTNDQCSNFLTEVMTNAAGLKIICS